MTEIEAFGEKIRVKDWHERLEEAKRRYPPSDDAKRIFAMREEELDAHCKKLREKEESNFWGSKERLAYYRSHGLSNCSDYPGGDAAFERDVLAGDQREEHLLFTFNLKREDAYICKCLENGRFQVDLDFRRHFYMHPKVVLAVEYVYTYVCGYTIQGPPPDYAEKIMSPDSDWYNEKDDEPSVVDYCPYPAFPAEDDE